MFKSIGGFIGEATKELSHRGTFHETLALTTARACLNFIIKEINVKLIYLPYYVCDSVLLPIIENSIAYKFYNINKNLEIKEEPIVLKHDEMLLYVNYFGIKSEYSLELYKRYTNNLILDNSQAFFHTGHKSCWSFNSVRKFFGVCDGAYLYSPQNKIKNKTINKAIYNTNYLKIRNLNDSSKAYDGFLVHENNLTCEIKLMSEFSLKLLSHINYQSHINSRIHNFNKLHNNLFSINLLSLESFTSNSEAPLYYPLLLTSKLQNYMVSQGIYVPFLWKEVITRNNNGFVWEKFLASNLLLLPIDQRYDSSDMNYLLNILTNV